MKYKSYLQEKNHRGNDAMTNVITEEMLNNYQKQCLEVLYDKISCRSGRHLSVIGRAGCGKKTLSYILAKRLSGKKVAFFTSFRGRVDRINEQLQLHGISAYCSTVKQMISDSGVLSLDCDIALLLGVSYEDRRMLKPLLPANCSVISFIAAGQEKKSDKDAGFNTLNPLFKFQFAIYETETIIDIRDVLFATVSEKNFIDKQISDNRCVYLTEELKLSRKAEAESRRRATELEGIVAFHEQILNCLGIPVEEIRGYIATLSEHKARISAIDPDCAEAEELIAELQDEQVAILAEIRSRFANGLAVESCEKELKLSIADNLWRRLDESARSYLITARYTFESMLKVDGDLAMDYSGVCLLITKVVEVEASRRFFMGYKSYLHKEFGSQYSLWPSEMLYLDNRYGKVKPTNVFTLGSVRTIFYGGGGRLSPLFMKYASKCLFSKMNTQDIESELIRDCEFIERLRCTYRNPAAHTGAFNKVGAAQCFDYVIEVHKMLQKMINKMDY